MFRHTGKRRLGLRVGVVGAAAVLVLTGCKATTETPKAMPPGQGDLVTDVHQNSDDFSKCLPGGVRHMVVTYWNDDDNGPSQVSITWNVDPGGTKHEIVKDLALRHKVPEKKDSADQFQPTKANLGHLFTVDEATGVIKKFDVKPGSAKSQDNRKTLFTDGGILQGKNLGPYTAGARNWGVIITDIPKNKPGAKGRARNKIQITIDPTGPAVYDTVYTNDCGAENANNGGGGKSGGNGKDKQKWIGICGELANEATRHSCQDKHGVPRT